MGLGTDAIKQLASQLAGRADALAEIEAAFNELALTRVAYLSGVEEARQKFAASKPVEFAPVLAAEVAKKLADIDKPRAVEGALEAEPAQP